MRHADEESELIKLILRYVTPDRRYLKLGGSLFGVGGRDRAKFARKLGEAASEISPRELGSLLDGGWRERKTAARLIAVAGRTEFRERLGELLLASEGPYVGQAHCVALATFGTSSGTDLLVAYLDRYLHCPDLYRPGSRPRHAPVARRPTRRPTRRRPSGPVPDSGRSLAAVDRRAAQEGLQRPRQLT